MNNESYEKTYGQVDGKPKHQNKMNTATENDENIKRGKKWNENRNEKKYERRRE